MQKNEKHGQNYSFSEFLMRTEPGRTDLERKSLADNQEEAYLKACLQGRFRRLLCERCDNRNHHKVTTAIAVVARKEYKSEKRTKVR